MAAQFRPRFSNVAPPSSCIASNARPANPMIRITFFYSACPSPRRTDPENTKRDTTLRLQPNSLATMVPQGMESIHSLYIFSPTMGLSSSTSSSLVSLTYEQTPLVSLTNCFFFLSQHLFLLLGARRRPRRKGQGHGRARAHARAVADPPTRSRGRTPSTSTALLPRLSSRASPSSSLLRRA